MWAGRRLYVHITVHTRRPTHTIYYNLYTFYIQIFLGLCAFLRDFEGFILIASLQERG